MEQDHAQYTEMDHAVWRFVLLQTYAHLQHTAHPAYKTGLAATGIRVDRIPRIDEMNEKLLRFGWGAVCVDGFIPPRAFQAFQANRILPIAAEIRSAEHLAYTPAPDIIHEAAGHAPILSEPAYAHFIQRFGAVSEKAFALPADRAVYQAIHLLSELKENPSSSAEQIAAATRAVHAAMTNVSELSEAARLARLYWWTAEYGLIGTVDDFRLYGAGLLSSLGESHSCREASVQKLALSAECVDFDYDITRAQPQLFVARDFDHLHSVLDEVSETLAHRSGGEHALEVARRSEELATLTLDTRLEVVGVVMSAERPCETTCLIQLSGAPALVREGKFLDDVRCPNDYLLVVGVLRGGRALSALSQGQLQRHVRSGRLVLELAGGVTLAGTVRGERLHEGVLDVVLLERFELTRPDGRVFRSQSVYPLVLAGAVSTVRAGAPAAYFGSSEPSLSRVPRPRWFSPREHQLLGLYEQAVEAWRVLAGAALVRVFERISAELERAYPDDWLLRWNLLESLTKVAEGGALTRQLIDDLERLEIKYLHREPIATGLAYVRAIAQDQSKSRP